MEKILEIKNISKIYSVGSLFSRIRITAVDNVSFYIKPAEIFTLAGESGCGKTTLSKIILGFEEPNSGEIIYENKSTKNIDRIEFMKKVQGVFQNPFESFNPLLPIEDIFFETIYNFKLTTNKNEAVKIIEEKLNAVGLSFEDIHNRYPNELSGGQLQRASIARALLTNPSILIADEPVSMVDASLRMSIVNLFSKLKNQIGLSVLYITHDLATAYYVSDRIAIMFRGNIIEMGPVNKVLLYPKHPYTQLLLESIPEADPEKKWRENITIADTEYKEYLKEGCKFAGRCNFVRDICKKERPKEIMIDDVLVRCHLYSENKSTISA
ncbi:ABC transporter ATP-binding protein [Dictyoglomus thermophilum]|uniref:ABC transporter ATP-binding protein n=1 Tax=Dictyoglomus thermophilum TaxID=14 RepID=A0A7V4DZ59_DICTH|nr:ABC transporter ATP-binding protein [Dictyoglomus thermophilum]TYT24204.1 ABC transporter ATP-binding protein [Dictyoglomus thermophilum]